MARSTRRMIERLEPFAELPRNASIATGMKLGDDIDGKTDGRAKSRSRPQRSVTKTKAK